MKNTIVAGSFQRLHVGHEALLKTAFENADIVYIGLMADDYIKKNKKGCVPYDIREKNLKSYLDSDPMSRDRYMISELCDAFGDSIYESFHVYHSITVSEETFDGALEVNRIRADNGMTPLTILVVPIVSDEKGAKISSTNIMKGLIDRNGDYRNRTTVTILGTTGGLGSEKRACAGILIHRNKDAVLLDCGNDTGLQLIKAKINQDDITAIFISHAHIDHYLGLPMLVFHQMMMYGRKKRLYIRAPIEVINIMKEIQSHYFEMPFEIVYDGYCDGYFTAIGDLHVTPFTVKHSRPESYGFKVVDELGRSVVYSGDTMLCERVIDESRGVDLLIHEATYGPEHNKELHGHSTVLDALKVFDTAKPKLMYVTHISIKYHADMTTYIEPLKGYRDICVASDLDVIKL